MKRTEERWKFHPCVHCDALNPGPKRPQTCHVCGAAILTPKELVAGGLSVRLDQPFQQAYESSSPAYRGGDRV